MGRAAGSAADPRSAAGPERERLVRRNTLLLAAGQGLAAVSFPVLLIVGSVAAAEITGRDGAVGVMNGVYFVSAALGALAFGRAMDRFGRRPGLVTSYLLLGGAGVVCGVGIAADSFEVLLLGDVLFGIAFGGTNLARGAVADMYEPDHRGRAVGLVLAIGTVGAVGSPFLIAFLRSWAAGEAIDGDVLAWILVPIVGMGAFACALALRPDPRDLAVGVPPAERPSVGRAPTQLLKIPMFRTAVLAAAVGQMAMVAIMGVTPVALHHHDTSTTIVSTVISFHIVGMWALAPLIGAALDRVGRRPILLLGGAISIGGCLLAATDAGAGAVGAGLFLIGLGWSGTFLGATAVISDLTEPHERAAALGFNDLLVSLSSAFAGLTSAFVFERGGFRVLGVGVATLVLIVAISVLRVRTPFPAAIAER